MHNDQIVIQAVEDDILLKHLDVSHHDHRQTWAKTKTGSCFRDMEAELFSRQCISWLTYAIYELTGILMPKEQANRICSYIEGSNANAAATTGSGLSVCSLVDDPVISTILAWSDKVMAFPYRSGFADWYEELKRCSTGGTFPGSSSAFSRKLNPLLQSLAALGISIDLSRHSGGVKVIVAKTEDDDTCLHSEPEDAFSNDLPKGQNDDDDNEVIRQLREKSKTNRGE